MLTVHVTKVFESGHMASFMYVFWKTFKETKGADFFDTELNIPNLYKYKYWKEK